MPVERADIKDIPALTRLRLAFLNEDSGGLSEHISEKLRNDLPVYFEKNLNQSIFCYLLREKDEPVACSFLLVLEKPPSPMFLNGRTGAVFNVYTKPAYRRRGYAKQIIDRLLEDASEMKLSCVDLKASKDGYHLYKSAGFAEETSKYRPMKWINPESRDI